MQWLAVNFSLQQQAAIALLLQLQGRLDLPAPALAELDRGLQALDPELGQWQRGLEQSWPGLRVAGLASAPDRLGLAHLQQIDMALEQRKVDLHPLQLKLDARATLPVLAQLQLVEPELAGLDRLHLDRIDGPARDRLTFELGHAAPALPSHPAREQHDQHQGQPEKAIYPAS